uniref:Reverse transcriptase domain-containing protein n=1 Tax=Romanomermis culicivorax TaxID=13658 RepID=A0A915HGN6_ROMCU
MEIDVEVNAIIHAMTKNPINQPTLSTPMLLDVNYTTPPVEAIAITTQDEIKRAQAADLPPPKSSQH